MRHGKHNDHFETTQDPGDIQTLTSRLPLPSPFALRTKAHFASCKVAPPLSRRCSDIRSEGSLRNSEACD